MKIDKIIVKYCQSFDNLNIYSVIDEVMNDISVYFDETIDTLFKNEDIVIFDVNIQTMTCYRMIIIFVKRTPSGSGSEPEV